jgi:hypothetical protein
MRVRGSDGVHGVRSASGVNRSCGKSIMEMTLMSSNSNCYACDCVEGAMSKNGSPSSSLCIVEIAINTNEGHILWGVAFKQNI